MLADPIYSNRARPPILQRGTLLIGGRYLAPRFPLFRLGALGAIDMRWKPPRDNFTAGRQGAAHSHRNQSSAHQLREHL
jgi:hypothetical protein